MAYEIVTKHSRNSEGEMTVSLGVGGIVYVSAKAMRDHFSSVEYVHLLFDVTNKKVAIKPLKEKQLNSFKLNFSSQDRKSTGMVTCRSFLKGLGLNDSSVKNIPAEWDEKNKFLEFELKK